MAKPQPKILYVINDMDWFWSHRLPLANAALEAGYEVIVAAPAAEDDPALLRHGFKGASLPAGGGPQTILAIRRTIAQHKPDIVHAITLKYAFMTGLAAQAIKDIKLVHTIAGLGYLFSSTGLRPKMLRFMTAPLLKAALCGPNTRLIFQNPDDLDVMVKRGLAKPQTSHLIRGSGVDLQQFLASAEPDNNPPIVVMPTRLVHEKGLWVFIEAAKILHGRGIAARYYIAGGISASSPRAISRLEMEDMIEDSPVEWLGKVSDMPGLLASANLVVYPSYYGEGVPKVLLEACAAGRAIVTTDHTGCREAVEAGVNGILVPVKNAQATADAIAALLRDDERRKKMGAAGRRKAELEFAATMVAAKTIEVYNTL